MSKKTNYNPDAQLHKLGPESSSMPATAAVVVGAVALTAFLNYASSRPSQTDVNSPVEGCRGTVRTVVPASTSEAPRIDGLDMPEPLTSPVTHRVGVVTDYCYPDSNKAEDHRYIIFNTANPGDFNPNSSVTYSREHGWVVVDSGSSSNK